MRTHAQLDRLGLRFARDIVDRIDADPDRAGLDRARRCCARWIEREPHPAYLEWQAILSRPWEEVRRVLLDESDEGQRLRQSSPFCGILSPQERWQIIKEVRADEAA